MYFYVCSKLPLHRIHKNKEGQKMCIDDKSKERYLQRKGKVFTRLPLQDCVARINVGHHLCTTFPTIHNYPFSQFPFFRSLFIVIITIYHYLSWIYHRGSLMHDAFADADALDIILFLLVMVILLFFFSCFFVGDGVFFIVVDDLGKNSIYHLVTNF